MAVAALPRRLGWGDFRTLCASPVQRRTLDSLYLARRGTRSHQHGI